MAYALDQSADDLFIGLRRRVTQGRKLFAVHASLCGSAWLKDESRLNVPIPASDKIDISLIVVVGHFLGHRLFEHWPKLTVLRELIELVKSAYESTLHEDLGHGWRACFLCKLGHQIGIVADVDRLVR